MQVVKRCTCRVKENVNASDRSSSGDLWQKVLDVSNEFYQATNISVQGIDGIDIGDSVWAV